ncbi:MAG: dephospho-CoA kinase, partial [Bacteroidota bacterium]
MSKSPLVIGITGGIGSGKSTVCRIFQLLGIPVYNADDRAKALTVSDQALRKKIILAFGDEAYKGKVLNRTYMARQVFSDKEKLAKLNTLIHPRVAEDFSDWVAINSVAPYVLKEA